MSDEQKEQNWMLGNTAAYRAILLKCAGELGADDPLAKAASLIAERRDAIAALRGLCERVGLPDNWPDNLHLADIIASHIEKYWPEEAKVKEEREACANIAKAIKKKELRRLDIQTCCSLTAAEIEECIRARK